MPKAAKQQLTPLKRVVVKIGSQQSVKNGKFNSGLMLGIFRQLREIQQQGFAPIVVLSGAIALGKTTFPNNKNAAAAVGQWRLIYELGAIAKKTQVATALLLISHTDVANRGRYNTLRATFDDLLNQHIIPIINANDATTLPHAPDFDDNDQLAILIAILTDAESVIVLTSVDGVYTANPEIDKKATLIHTIKNINLEIIKQLGQGKNESGRGGMASKLKAARLATAVGIEFRIASGQADDVLTNILIKRQSVGTVCLPRSGQRGTLGAKDRWIVSARNSAGSIQIDNGAANAVKQRKSLLAVGVTKIYGQFDKHQSVELIDRHYETVALGIVNLSSIELNHLLQTSTKPYDTEIVHADNMRLLV